MFYEVKIEDQDGEEVIVITEQKVVSILPVLSWNWILSIIRQGKNQVLCWQRLKLSVVCASLSKLRL